MALKYFENCVYAVQTPDGVKVGFTSRLGDRLSAFQKTYNAPCYPVALATGLNRKAAMELEARIHESLSNKKVAREVFNVTVKEICACFRVEDLAQ